MVKQKKSAIGIIGAVGFLVLAAGTVYDVVIKIHILIYECHQSSDTGYKYGSFLWSFSRCAIGILMVLALLISFVSFIRQKHSAVTALGPLLCAVSYFLYLFPFSVFLIRRISTEFYVYSNIIFLIEELLCCFIVFLSFIEMGTLILSDFDNRFRKLARAVRKTFYLPVILWMLTVTIFLPFGYDFIFNPSEVTGGIIATLLKIFIPYKTSAYITNFVIYPLILLFPVLWAAYPDGLRKKNIPVPAQNPAGTQGVYQAGGTVPAPTPSSVTANEQGGSPDIEEITAQPANNGGDSAEQIRRYKALLDEGAITADEYEAKKKQLLGL